MISGLRFGLIAQQKKLFAYFSYALYKSRNVELRNGASVLEGVRPKKNCVHIFRSYRILKLLFFFNELKILISISIIIKESHDK